MKFFSFYEILNSVISSFSIGLIFGALYNGAKSIFFYLFSFVYLLPGKIIKLFFFEKKKRMQSGRKISDNLVDFMYFILFGTAILITVYITLDGVLRLYFFLFAVFAFFLGSHFLGTRLKIIIEFIMGNAYRYTESVLNFIFKPLDFLFKKIKIKAGKIKGVLIDKRLIRRSKKLMQVKIEGIEKIFISTKT